jgi:urease accessory protein
MNTENSITMIRNAMPAQGAAGETIAIHADRWQLAKLRWRATAADGREFGFELEAPLRHGDLIWENYHGTYTIVQDQEDVLVVTLPDAPAAAGLAWAIGNLHQPLQVTAAEIITEDDAALRHLFEQQHLSFTLEKRVFEPVRAVIAHPHRGDHPSP